MKQKIFLLADDDRDDSDLFCEALADVDNSIVCHCAGNGREALNLLEELAEMPGLIFLDINMPLMNGWECLERLKQDERHKAIPVIMYSTSSHQREIDTAISMGALCFFAKPTNYNDLKEILQVIATNVEGNLVQAIHHFTAISPNKTFSCTGG